jgi:microcompartment protein CcmK/EutM
MQMGLVVGTATSTVKHGTMRGQKLLVVQPVMADGRTPDGDPQIAVDAVGAGKGERVMIMTYSEQDVERIVLEVIRRLGLVGSPSATATNELAVSERVVTMRSIEGKLAGINRLIVSGRAVVTPAVKDELRQRNIELVRRG